MKHRQLTAVSNELILKNLRALSQRGHNIELRVPIVPGINDDDESIRQIGAFAAALPHLRGVAILPYHGAAVGKYERLGRVYGLPTTRSPLDERMSEMANILRGFGLQTRIGG